MKLQIPAIGQELTLIRDWKFRLFYESRNEKLLVKLGHSEPKKKGEYGNLTIWERYKKKMWVEAVLVTGTNLAVDRIYIKRATKDLNKDGEYNSLSFWIRSGPFKGCRFWAKLADVNTIDCLWEL